MSDREGTLVSNPEFVTYHQQDKLLASSLLSTVSANLLSYFTGTSCDLLEASSHPISTEEQVEFMLVGLSVEFDSILTPASFLTEPLKMD